MKGYTSIEQSKKALELGLSPESADMMHIATHPFIKEFDKDRIEWVSVGKEKKRGHWNVPCWSLAALLELIPLTIEEEENKRYHLEIRGLDYNEGYSICHTDPHGFLTIGCQCLGESLIDATYNYICWLLENKYI